MNWVCRFSSQAEQELIGLPKFIQARVARVVEQMGVDPFQGNIKALQGRQWKGVFRRRIGDYRLLFTADHARRSFLVLQISVRSGSTYD